MIVCKKCGNQNPDDATFCTSCRAFLEWSGEKVVEPPPPAPPPPPPASEPETHFVDRVKQAVGLEASRADTDPHPTAVSAASVTPKAADAPPPAAVPPPVAEVPVARAPQAVAPAPERPRQLPRTETATAQRYKPGDVICGQCGASNSPERHFCQRCGANLSAAAVVKVPWYRRLLPAKSAPAAGVRPQAAPVERAWGAALSRIIAVGVILAVVLGYLVVPPLRNRVNTAVASGFSAIHRQFRPSISYVFPSDAKASSQLPLHPARLSIDHVSETYWAANTATDKQPWLRFTFGGPVDFDQLLFTSGAANDFATMARPKEVVISMSDKSTRHITLKDDPGAIGYDLPGRQITWVQILILSVYPTAQSTDVAINEVEFVRIQ